MLAAAINSASPSAQAPTAPSPKLVSAAHEFEAQMMKELLKPLSGGSTLGGEDAEAEGGLGSGGGSTSALGEYASEALGRSISEHGGFGIANHILKELSCPGHHGGSS